MILSYAKLLKLEGRLIGLDLNHFKKNVAVLLRNIIIVIMFEEENETEEMTD